MTEGGLVLPADMNQTFSYGRVVTDSLDSLDNKLLVFDPLGARQLELDPTKDSGMVVIDRSMIYAEITEAELVERALPIP